MSGWPDTSATHGQVTFTRGADDLVIGAGGAVKATSLRGLMAYGTFLYSDVPLSDQPGESPSRPTLGPLRENLSLMLRGDVLLEDDTDAESVAGLQQNLYWLREFCAPFTTGAGVFDTELVVPAVGTFSGEAHLELLLGNLAPYNSHGSFVIDLPLLVTVSAGSLTLETP
jgi:hypothetical protein